MQPSSQAADALRSRILGCWEMISWTRTLVGSSEEVDALGPDPFGYISYTPDNRVMVFVLKNSRKRPLSNTPSDSEKIGLFNSMFAYVGSY
jgi:Lipocalin-like domain